MPPPDRASTTLANGVTVTVLFRPPRVGERGWYALASTEPEEVLRSVVSDMDGAGPDEFGWPAFHDYPEYDEDGDRVVTVIARARGQSEQISI